MEVQASDICACNLHVEQEQPTLPEHMGPHPDVSGVHVAQSLVFCLVFCR